MDQYHKDAETEKSRSMNFRNEHFGNQHFFKIVIRIHFYILVQCQYEQNIFVFSPSLNIALKLIHYSQPPSKCYFSPAILADFYIFT